MPKLDNWWYLPAGSHPFFLDKPVLVGDVTGHPRIADGKHICTAAVVEFAPEAHYARTLNHTFMLGKPADDPTGAN